MSRKRKQRKKSRAGLYLVMLVIGIFLTTLVVQGVSLRTNCQKLATEQSELEEKKKSLEQEKEKIKEEEEYSKTDEYIEDIAREKFGLVYENEIIFKPEE